MSVRAYFTSKHFYTCTAQPTGSIEIQKHPAKIGTHYTTCEVQPSAFPEGISDNNLQEALRKIFDSGFKPSFKTPNQSAVFKQPSKDKRAAQDILAAMMNRVKQRMKASHTVELTCPILEERLTEPMLLSCCQKTLSKHSLETRLNIKKQCPCCREALTLQQCFPNKALQPIIKHAATIEKAMKKETKVPRFAQDPEIDEELATQIISKALKTTFDDKKLYTIYKRALNYSRSLETYAKMIKALKALGNNEKTLLASFYYIQQCIERGEYNYAENLLNTLDDSEEKSALRIHICKLKIQAKPTLEDCRQLINLKPMDQDHLRLRAAYLLANENLDTALDLFEESNAPEKAICLKLILHKVGDPEGIAAYYKNRADGFAREGKTRAQIDFLKIAFELTPSPKLYAVLLSKLAPNERRKYQISYSRLFCKQDFMDYFVTVMCENSPLSNTLTLTKFIGKLTKAYKRQEYSQAFDLIKPPPPTMLDPFSSDQPTSRQHFVWDQQEDFVKDYIFTMLRRLCECESEKGSISDTTYNTLESLCDLDSLPNETTCRCILECIQMMAKIDINFFDKTRSFFDKFFKKPPSTALSELAIKILSQIALTNDRPDTKKITDFLKTLTQDSRYAAMAGVPLCKIAMAGGPIEYDLLGGLLYKPNVDQLLVIKTLNAKMTSKAIPPLYRINSLLGQCHNNYTDYEKCHACLEMIWKYRTITKQTPSGLLEVLQKINFTVKCSTKLKQYCAARLIELKQEEKESE